METVIVRESLADDRRAPLVDPLIRRVANVFRQRFRRQLAALLKDGLPRYRKPLDALKEREPEDSVKKVLEPLDTLEFTAPAVDRAIARAVASGANLGLAEIGGVVNLTFSIQSPAVLEYLKTRSLSKIGADVDMVTRDRLRAVLVRAYAERWTYAATVKAVKGLYAGFTARAPQKYIGSRAELIAQYEIGNAFNAGTLAAAESLEARGVQTDKTWLLGPNPCTLCQGNAAQSWIPSGKAFASGHSAPLGHPACRCALAIRPSLL